MLYIFNIKNYLNSQKSWKAHIFIDEASLVNI